MKSCRFLLALVYLAFSSVAFGQATTASLTGVVDDPSKAVIPKVSVTAINTETGAKTQTFTNKEGIYVFPSLQTGNYRVEVDKQGFKGIIEAGLTLHVQDVLQLNFHMAVGSMSESVTVNAGELSTATGTVSTVIGHEFIENMPLNGNDLTTLFELTPGTLLNAGGQGAAAGGGFSVDGQRPTANYLTIDGASGEAYVSPSNAVNNTGAGIATSASGGTNGILPVDAIEEYRMDTSTYTAENGRTPGGQIQVRTRSGTNQFHGTLFENFRNQVFNADDWFTKYDNIAQAPLHMNEFGGTLGGPVIIPHLFDGKNRLFFFVANDNMLLNQPTLQSQTEVPDASILAGAYPLYQTWLSAFPSGNKNPDGTPQQLPGIPSFDYFNYSYSSAIRDHTTSVRLDWQLPRSIHAFFRTNIAPSSSLQPAILGSGSQFHVDTYTGGLTIPLGSHIVDDLTINRTNNNTRNFSFVGSVGGDNANAIQNNLPPGVDSSTDSFNFFVSTTGSDGYAQAGVGASYASDLHQWNIVDTLTLQRGKSNLKFGADVLTRQMVLKNYENYYNLEVLFPPSPSYAGSDLDTGMITSLTYASYQALPIISLFNTSLFVNEDWKATRSLTLNAGVRWEFNPAPSVGPLGTLAVVGDNLNPATFQANVSNNPLYQSRYDNFAPRFGFSWKPRSESGMVIRGGVGIYFDTGQAGTLAGTTAASTYPYQYTQTYTEVPFASVNWSGLTGNQAALPVRTFDLVDPNLLSPRTYEWSLTLDQDFGKHTKLTTSYVGNDGERLIGEEEYYNAKNSAKQYPVNINYIAANGRLYIIRNQSHSNYQALQAQLTSKIGERFSALASYTWGHAEDNGSTDFSSAGGAALNPMANSTNDIRQMFATAIHYAPGGVTGNPILRALTEGWGIDTIARLQSASPLTVTFTNTTDDNINQYLSNADTVTGMPVILHEHIDSNGKVVPGNILLNHAAFQAPPTDSSGNQLRNGNSPTNGYRLFGLKQWDLAASRSWKIWEGLHLNFRVDAFNLLNTVNFSNVSNIWNSSNAGTFGRSNTTYASYNGGAASGDGTTGAQLSAFQNGGPRELQLSMKLKF